MFKAELEHQITLASNEERIKDIENDAADAMDDNAAAVSSNRCRSICNVYTFLKSIAYPFSPMTNHNIFLRMNQTFNRWKHFKKLRFQEKDMLQQQKLSEMNPLS